MKKHNDFDKEKFRPAILSSICTGEKTAGFQDKITKKFTSVMLITSQKDLNDFFKEYDIKKDDVVTIY